MPTVPTIEQKVAPAPMPGIRVEANAPAEAFRLGEGQATVDKAIMEGLRDARRRADEIAVGKADRSIADIAASADLEARKSRGDGALAASEAAINDFDKAMAEIDKGLASGEQRRAFQKRALERRMALDHGLRVHVAGEKAKFDDETTKARIEADQLEIRRNYLEQPLVEAKIASSLQTWKEFAERNGLPAERRDIEASRLQSGLRSDVVKSYIANKQIVDARKYYLDHKDAILPDDREKLEQLLSASERSDEAMAKADEIAQKWIDRYAPLEGQEMRDLETGELTTIDRYPTLEDAFRDIQSIEDADVRKEVSNLVAHRFSAFAQQQDANAKARYKKAYGVVLETKSYDAIDDLTKAELDPDEKASLMKLASELSKPAGVQTDWVEYYKLRDEAARNPNAFALRNILQSASKLAPSELEKLMDLQAGVVSGNRKAEADNDDYRTVSGIIEDAMRISGAFGSGFNRNSDAEAKFKVAVDAELKKIPGWKKDDVERIVNRMLTKVIVAKGNVWHTRKRYWEVAPEEQVEEVEYSEIPIDERNWIEDFLTKETRGIKPTPEVVQAYYRNRLQEMRGGR